MKRRTQGGENKVARSGRQCKIGEGGPAAPLSSRRLVGDRSMRPVGSQPEASFHHALQRSSTQRAALGEHKVWPCSTVGAAARSRNMPVTASGRCRQPAVAGLTPRPQSRAGSLCCMQMRDDHVQGGCRRAVQNQPQPKCCALLTGERTPAAS